MLVEYIDVQKLCSDYMMQLYLLNYRLNAFNGTMSVCEHLN